MRVPYGRVAHSGRGTLGEAALYHYWHPDRDGVEPCPADFARTLRAIEPGGRDLACVRPPASAPVPSRAWLVWYRCPRISHRLCPGWQLLFVWQQRVVGENGQLDTLTPLPLDSRVLANLYRVSASTFGSALGYFQSVVSTLEREARARDEARTADRHDRAK